MELKEFASRTENITIEMMEINCITVSLNTRYGSEIHRN